MSESTPERFLLERWRLAQSSGECPGFKSTFPRAFGVLGVGAVGGRPKLPFEEGGPRFGSGPRFGIRPFAEDEMGRDRRFEGATRGGGMREDVVGIAGGAMRFGLVGGGMEKEGVGADALWAEFKAGKEGGGRLSSSSSLDSSFSCSLSVKVGTAGAS